MTTGKLSNSCEHICQQVFRIRFAQLEINERLKRKEYKIPVHMALGHEAIAAAVSEVMSDDDTLCLTHRNIHYNLARATSLRPEFAELSLQDGGIANGRLGSMNMSNPERGIIYTASILANNLCVSSGVAIGHKVNGKGGVNFVVTGDGAMEEGVFSETLLFLKSFSLPSVVIVENNGWSLATRIEERRAAIDLEALVHAYGAEYLKLKGNNAIDYVEKLRTVRNIALERSSPMVVEVELTTLGSWLMETDDFPDGKFINYHHGPAGTVSLEGWPVICEDNSDPIHVLGEIFDQTQMRDMATYVRAAVVEDLG